MQDIVNGINDIVWSPALIYLCLGVGLFYSIVTRFMQVRHFFEMWRLLISRDSSKEGVSSFQALTLSLSGRVGTGNIAGVSAAIGFGGPGAVFWMWVMAFLGAATSYIECTLGQIYKEECDGQYRGGPAYYFEKATGQKWYAIIFAVATIVATGVLLPGVQSNSIGNAVSLALGDDQSSSVAFAGVSYIKFITGVALVLVLSFIIFGGTKRIAQFAEIVVPFMAIGYVFLALIVVGSHITLLPAVITLIVTDAFSPMAGLGAAVGWGVKRGVYSNEAGQGTGPHASAAAEVQHPAQQGLVQAFAVYVDTLLVCTATAMMIIITGAYNVHGADSGVFLVQNLGADVAANSPTYTQLALESVFPGLGKFFVAFALVFFAFTTIVAYFYIAETNVAYLRRTFKVPGVMLGIKILIITSTFYGAIKTANLAWGLGDIGVGLMAWLNIIGILFIFFISRPALKALLDYEAQKKLGVKNYTFDPEKLGIKNADFWVLRLAKKSKQ
jgi:alanine or glycine:cation symporter, AGCS family